MAASPQLCMAAGPSAKFVDCRREVRTVCQGEVHLQVEDESRLFILAEVLDVSSSGFRAAYHDSSLAPGTQVRFRHKFFQGRAQVVWTSPMLRSSQSGFQVVRDA